MTFDDDDDNHIENENDTTEETTKKMEKKIDKFSESVSFFDKVSAILSKANNSNDLVEVMKELMVMSIIKDMAQGFTRPTPPPQPSQSSQNMNWKDIVGLLQEQQREANERMDKFITSQTEMNKKLMELTVGYKEKEMEVQSVKREKELETKEQLQKLKDEYERKIDELREEFEANRQNLSPEQTKAVEKKMSALQELTELMDNYKETKDFFNKLGEMFGGEDKKEKPISVKEIANTIKDIAEPLVDSAQTILGIAGQPPVQPPAPNFNPAEPPKKVNGGSEGKKTENNSPQPPQPPQDIKEPEPDFPNKWSDIEVKETGLDPRDEKEISKYIKTHEMVIDGKKDVAVQVGNDLLTDDKKQLLTKKQFDYFYVNDPDFRKAIKDIKEASNEKKE